MGLAANIFEKPIPSLQPRVSATSGEKLPSREFDTESAKHLFNGVTSWESLEKTLEYLVYVPMSNGEKIFAKEWISRVDRVRNGESAKLLTSIADFRATAERLLKTIGP